MPQLGTLAYWSHRRSNRDCERGITLEYLQALHRAYEEFIRDISRAIPVIKVDYAKFRTTEEMALRIQREYDRIHNIRLVRFAVASGGDSPVDASTPSPAAEPGVAPASPLLSSTQPASQLVHITVEEGAGASA